VGDWGSGAGHGACPREVRLVMQIRLKVLWVGVCVGRMGRVEFLLYAQQSGRALPHSKTRRSKEAPIY
jgi:hypothetical protein